jgi:hypothetical protein
MLPGRITRSASPRCKRATEADHWPGQYRLPAAGMFHANFAPALATVKPASQTAWYIVHGKAAAGQLAVLGSEPGESDYSPLCRTVFVTWQPGSRPRS